MADYVRGQLLISLREDRHLSQEAAAAEIGVSAKSLRSWEKGGSIRWHNAEKLGGFYKVDPATLVEHESARDDTPDLMGALAPAENARLDQIERKLDEVLEILAALELPAGFEWAVAQAAAQRASSAATPGRTAARRKAS